MHFVITGASSGLGAALSRGSAPNVKSLTLLGRDQNRLRAISDDCRRLGANVEINSCDVRNADAMRDALLNADDRCKVDVVIANAAIGGAAVLPTGPSESQDLAHEIVATNLSGTINTITPLQERFIARRSGKLVLISSMAAFEGLADAPMYAASKAAVRIYGHGLRRRLAPYDVHVTVVSPGFVTTPMSQSLPFSHPFTWSAEKAAQRILQGIMRNEHEIAFPWQLRIGVAMSQVLPVSLVDKAISLARSRLRPK